MSDSTDQQGTSPLDSLGVMAMQSVAVDDNLDHLELYTSRGLVTILWHGAADLEAVVVCVGGAMGGLLGPDQGLYQRLGRALPAAGIGVMRVDYRAPNDLTACVQDTVSAMELAARHGAHRFVTLGHSFGGAVALQAAMHLDRRSVPGVVTFATQSAGCENAGLLADRDLLFFHGTNDRILPMQASEVVRALAGTGELVLLDGADHLLAPAGGVVFDRLMEHLPAVFAAADVAHDEAPAAEADADTDAGAGADGRAQDNSTS
jgi:dienelactone hydrolase